MPNGSAGQPSPSDEADKPPTRFERDLVKWTRSVAWFTGLLFLANAGALFFIYEQWSVANKAQVDTREQLRAAVSFVGAAQIQQTDKDGKIVLYGFSPQFQNNGGTRTAVFHAWASVKYFDAVPNNMDFSKPYQVVDQAEIVIGPNSSAQIGPVGIFGDDLSKALSVGSTSILWGSAEYSDIFQPGVLHHLSFCLALRPSQPSGDTPIKTVLAPSPYRNDCNTSD